MIRPKKSLGQNFLIDKNIIDKIINTVSIAGNEILEVGPGTGNLTREILKNNPSKMYLVEKDTFLAESLKEIIDERVIIFNEDIIKFDENSLSKNELIEQVCVAGLTSPQPIALINLSEIAEGSNNKQIAENRNELTKLLNV